MSCKAIAIWLLLLPAFCCIAEGRASVLNSIPTGSDAALYDHDPVVHDYFLRSTELVFYEKHARCLEILDRFAASYPDHPAPDFFKAACDQSYMNTFRSNRFTAVMDRHVDAAIAKGRSLLKHSDDPWLHLYVGASYGFRALNRFRRHVWIEALLNIKNSIDHMQPSLEKAPNLYDAYMGIGVYNYWRTARSRFIRKVAFWMTDRREIGLQQLRFVVTNAAYAARETSYNLIAAYIDAGRFEAALALVDRNIALKGSPLTIDLYYKGRVLIALGRWQQAETIHKALLVRLNASPLAVDGYKAEVSYHVALSLFNQKQYSPAHRFSSAALQHCVHRRPEDEIESSFESFEEIQSRLERLHQRLTSYLKSGGQDTAAVGTPPSGS